MTRRRLYPHRTADIYSVSWHNWWIERDGERTPLPPVLKGWDYDSQETIGISVDLDAAAVLESTGLESIDDFQILATADCLAVQRRFVASRLLCEHDQGTTIHVSLQLPSGQIADALRLSAHLVLARTTQDQGDRVAFLHGARLHSSEPVTVRLEGDSGRFPTEAVPFSELGYGNAPWTVLTFYGELSDSFLGGVRLFINTEHPAGRLALDPKGAPRVSGLLRAEVMRLLIATAVDHSEDADETSFEEGSVGQVLDTMCQLFLGQRLLTSVRLYKDDPARFEILLHDRLDPIVGVIA